MKRLIIVSLAIVLIIPGFSQSSIIIDHNCTQLNNIPVSQIEAASTNLHIAYGHASHGSQLVYGMTGIYAKYGNSFAFNNGGSDGALDLHVRFTTGDLGNPDFNTWADLTRTYLNANADVNVVIWSWCGEVSSATQDDIDTYLSLMDELEDDYPGVQFVYMTGHLDGTGADGVLNLNNERIRSFCLTNNKIIYDFAEIESYDPDGAVN